MKLLLVDNVHIYKTDDGEYYTPSIYNKSFFDRYLKVFSSVRLVAKTRRANISEVEGFIHIDFENVEIFELEWYKGIKELIFKLPKIIPRLRTSTVGCGCIIYRVAQIESFLVYKFVKKSIPYAVEVVNDPECWDFVGKTVRSLSSKMLRHICKNANGAAYVTERYLQKKYPCSNKAFSSYYSSIELEEKYILSPKHFDYDELKIVHVSNAIDGNEKGHDTVLLATKKLINEGYKIRVCFIGGGPGVQRFIQMADDENIGKFVDFVGRISNKDEYMSALAQNDVLVFPSHSEGLPRVVIESMACGLPCIVSPVGGTPELVDDWCLVNFDDVNGYVRAISNLINDRELYRKTSKNNFEKSKSFEITVLERRRTAFYKKLEGLADKQKGE